MEENKVQPSRVMERVNFYGFWGVHAAPLAAFWTGVTGRALFLGFVLYWTRMFVVTAGYHRYFAHRSFRTSRFMQFLIALLGTTVLQKGPIWWAAQHRHHHKYSDKPEDVHSPVQHGFWQSHMGWVASGKNAATDLRLVPDLLRYPELRWLDEYHWVAPAVLTIACYFIAGGSGVAVGMGWSTVILWHSIFTINSIAHVFGKRRYATHDDSRNNWFLALLTMGEGWHNNHHHCMNSARQGFFWWEIDLSYYLIRFAAAIGLVQDVKEPPPEVFRSP